MLGRPIPADPEIAALTFQRDLDTLWASRRPDRDGWRLMRLDPLRVVVTLPGIRTDGTVDDYFVKLGAEYYDAFPPTTVFVDPDGWREVRSGTRWFPLITSPGWFGLHDGYPFPDGTARQLVCFTFTAEYYMVSHSPPETTVWRQGRHTVAATLARLAEVLRPPYYQGPSG